MRTAIIIGAGPAGLTAAYELLTQTDIIPVIIEADIQPGGLSKTINYKGNKIDIGGHRFFSKSERVVKWWLQFLPLADNTATHPLHLHYQNKDASFDIADAPKSTGNNNMMVRQRRSRIFFQKKFYDYPLKLNWATIINLGFKKMMSIVTSYSKAKLFPIKKEENLEHFFINRFGNTLYQTFFKDYTEKVWGVPCNQIPASWGKQRIKDLNIGKLLLHAVKNIFTSNRSLNQKGTSTSLIEQFLYPKYGPGQMWQKVADEIEQLGGKIIYNTAVKSVKAKDDTTIESVTAINNETKETVDFSGDYFFSTMPVKELIDNLTGITIDKDIADIAHDLEYRDFIIAGVLVKQLKVQPDNKPIDDNWIYIQDGFVKAGRLQIFNNWSPFMVQQPNTTWLGVEYFCTRDDAFWKKSDEDIAEQAVNELVQLGLIEKEALLDSMVARVEKAYPSYYGSYDKFEQVQRFTDKFENLFLIGRNGMHRYNNSDHSMLTAITAVENIISNRKDKSNIWEINTEEDYHEEVNK